MTEYKVEVGQWVLARQTVGWFQSQDNYEALGPVQRVTAKRCWTASRWGSGDTRPTQVDLETVALAGEEALVKRAHQQITSSKARAVEGKASIDAQHRARIEKIIARANARDQEIA